MINSGLSSNMPSYIGTDLQVNISALNSALIINAFFTLTIFYKLIISILILFFMCSEFNEDSNDLFGDIESMFSNLAEDLDNMLHME